MNKDYSKKILLSFSTEKQIKVLYDLAIFIEKNNFKIDSSHFHKLNKYHEYLNDSIISNIQILNKEFKKIRDTNYQFQVYLMNLERLLGQSNSEYQFLVSTQDKENENFKKFPLICLLDSIRSAHNIGAMFRNAECFGVEKILLCGLSPTPENPAVVKTAMGCDKKVNWSYHKSALEIVNQFKKIGYEIWSIETANNSINLNEISTIASKVVLIFGHEQFGVSLELLKASDKIISLPLYGLKNSLNVSVCQGIILNQLTSKMS